MNDHVEFLNLSPLHLNSLSVRMKEMTQLKEHINATSKTFQAYSEVGAQLCSCMSKLSASFQDYQEFQSDPALKAISDLLNKFQSSLKIHYEQIQDHIITPLKEYVKNDITSVEEKGKEATKAIDAYFKTVENYTMISKKKPQNELDEADVRLKKCHKKACFSDYLFMRSLDLVERRKLIEVLAHFVAFINLAGVAYRECLFEFEEQKKSFETLQFAIADLQKQLQKHENETRIQEKSLESVYNVFWKKLKVDFPSTPALEHEGYLWKKGSGFTKSWQKRYFICKNHKLAYYHNADDSDKPQGELPLLLTTIKPIVDSDRRFTFTIISTGKTYTLQALTKYDMDEWMAVIKNNIQYLLDHSDEKSEKSVQSKNDKVSDILALECNKHCADCGAECPTWCCINWGVCICINCSGIHRSFTPISKVRSLTLDRLDNYSKRALEALNNENANSILEANIGHNKIEPNCSKEEREEFIRRKYIKCKFVDDSKEVDILEAIRSKNAPAVLHALCLHRKQGKPMQTSGYTPLHLAASLGDPIICHIIATNMKTPDILDDAGWSPLSYATYYGHAEACECLIQNNCDPRLSKAAHPYQIAMSQNKTNLVAMFLPYWDGNPDTVPDQEFKPPVQTDIGVTQSVNQKYASLDILGTLQF